MGTGSVDGGHRSGNSYCDGACPLFRAAALGHRGKRGQAPSRTFFQGFGIYCGSEPVPIFLSSFVTKQGCR